MLKVVEMLSPLAGFLDKQRFIDNERLLALLTPSLDISGILAHIRPIETSPLWASVEAYGVVATDRLWTCSNSSLASLLDMDRAKTPLLPRKYSSPSARVNS